MAVNMCSSHQEMITSQSFLFGTLTTNLYDLWSQYRSDWTKNNQLSIDRIFSLFYLLGIYPSSSQVHEMLCCAAESGHRSSSDGLTFGEFCVFASELKASRINDIKPLIPLSKLPDNCAKQAKRPKRTISCSSSNYEVFLGGSCNPTTWRKDVAIPIMKNMDITYYNPQVSHWGPELIELENQAKQNADVLFFVIDNQTRSVASIIEAAHLAGSHRKLILVINAFEGPGDKVLCEPITDREYEDLKVGQAHLQDLVERQNIPVFRCIKTALKCTSKVVKQGISVQDLSLEDGATPVRMSHIRPGEKIVKLREIFSTLDTTEGGLISLSDVSMGIRILTGKNLSSDNLQKIYENCLKDHKNVNLEVRSKKISDEFRNDTKAMVNFDQFCCIVAEYKPQLKNSYQTSDSVLHRVSSAITSIIQPVSKMLAWAIPKRLLHPVPSQNQLPCSQGMKMSCGRDIFLGGSHGESLWREEIAIPTLKKYGITYYNPKVKSWVERLIPIQLAAVENSQVLLFIITNQTRSLGSMAVAAHYVGLGCNLVLCIQYLVEDTVIGGEKLSKQAVKDYNRGRVYLSDLANRDGIPVFDDIQDAVDCAISKVLNSPS